MPTAGRMLLYLLWLKLMQVDYGMERRSVPSNAFGGGTEWGGEPVSAEANALWRAGEAGRVWGAEATWGNGMACRGIIFIPSSPLCSDKHPARHRVSGYANSTPTASRPSTRDSRTSNCHPADRTDPKLTRRLGVTPTPPRGAIGRPRLRSGMTACTMCISLHAASRPPSHQVPVPALLGHHINPSP